MAAVTKLSYAVAILVLFSCVSANFYTDFASTWGKDHATVSGIKGSQLQLSLDNRSGSAFQSNKEYLFGKFDMQIKLVRGNSAGTVTTFYLSSNGSHHDEIDFEFLGNLSGNPHVLHTNIYSNGVGNREQQFYLWFDPTLAFHTYSVVWNPKQIIIFVDGNPIRVFNNYASLGVPFPNKQPMRIFGSIWNGDNWATRGGLVKINWTQAPFVASYKNFQVEPCVSKRRANTNCAIYSKQTWWNQTTQSLDSRQQRRLAFLQRHYMIYNYCTDGKRFPQGLPPECPRQSFNSTQSFISTKNFNSTQSFNSTKNFNSTGH